MTARGHGKRDIARALTADRILIPAAYAAEHCPDGKTYDSDNAFIYGSYRSLHRDCTMHYIKVSVTREVIKKAIHTVSSFAIENEEEFVRRLEVLSDFQVETAIKESQIPRCKQRGIKQDTLQSAMCLKAHGVFDPKLQ